MIGVEQRRKWRNPNQKSGRRKRALLGVMTLRGTVNRRRVRSQSQRKRSGSPHTLSHRLAPPPWKAQNQKWRLRVRKVRKKDSWIQIWFRAHIVTISTWVNLFNLVQTSSNHTNHHLSFLPNTEAFWGHHVPVSMQCVHFSCSQRHLAALCQSDSGQISSAAGGHALHHHSRLSSHCWQVCVIFSLVMWQQELHFKKSFDTCIPSRNECIVL